MQTRGDLQWLWWGPWLRRWQDTADGEQRDTAISSVLKWKSFHVLFDEFRISLRQEVITVRKTKMLMMSIIPFLLGHSFFLYVIIHMDLKKNDSCNTLMLSLYSLFVTWSCTQSFGTPFAAPLSSYKVTGLLLTPLTFRIDPPSGYSALSVCFG